MSHRSPLPDVDWEPLAGFWAGAAAGELRLPRCTCGAFRWYPRERCRHCGATDHEWVRTSGRGTLFSWAVVHRTLYEAYAELVPYATGLVALAEDPRVRIATRLVDCDPGELRIEMPVHAVFARLSFPGIQGSVPAPLFTPTR
jgi:hypothetical protein